VAIPSTNFKRQNTIDAASIKENTARMNSRPNENMIGECLSLFDIFKIVIIILISDFLLYYNFV